ncbi:MAG: ATP-binding protein [Nitrospirota bacterium]
MECRGRSVLVMACISCSDTRSCLQEASRDLGFSVVIASDPSVAKATAELTDPDIVVAELTPASVETESWIREWHECRPACPILVVGSLAEERAVLEVLKVGVLEYLTLPVDRAQWRKALEMAKRALPIRIIDLPAMSRVECTIVCEADPSLIEPTVSWVMQNGTAAVAPGRRTHLRAALQELLLNAVEHGSLEILYKEKQEALNRGTYEELIAAKLRDPRIAKRRVTVRCLYDKAQGLIRYQIADEGKGFHWKSLLGRSTEPCEAREANGRGLFLVRSFFPDVAYNERGNEVTLTIPMS